MYIYRELHDKIRSYLTSRKSAGIILSGIVGCGKTTMVQKMLESLSHDYTILSFTGDDIHFRNSIIDDSKFLFNEVRSHKSKINKSLIFVDEVQKCEEIFDALKYAFDHGETSFIVSGSNPAYLSTVAKRRLQRRAEQFFMMPISLSEIGVQKNWVTPEIIKKFEGLLFHQTSIEDFLTDVNIRKEPDKESLDLYLKYGGLPLVYTTDQIDEKLREIRLIVERGFDLFSKDNNRISEIVRVELAKLHSLEFTYKNILERARVRKRDIINENLDALINHGYLVKKKPLLLESGRSTYLSVFSFIDPGIVTYLKGETPDNLGPQVEGYIHARMSYYILNSVYKTELFYFKPYTIDSDDNVRFKPKEIDFVMTTGRKMLPIEVKAGRNRKDFDISLLCDFISQNKLPFGILFYAGIPHWDSNNKILFWPYWAV